MHSRHTCVILILLVAACGCDDGDRRLAEMAREAAGRQAEQNARMACLQEHVTAMQQDVQRSQAEVGRQRDLLEGERREIAGQRQRDPIVAAAIVDVGLVLACLLPLLLAGFALYCLRDQGQADSAVAEVLITELITDKPLLLPPPRSVAAIVGETPPSAERKTLSE